MLAAPFLGVLLHEPRLASVIRSSGDLATSRRR
jgi:hypothetical protein